MEKVVKYPVILVVKPSMNYNVNGSHLIVIVDTMVIKKLRLAIKLKQSAKICVKLMKNAMRYLINLQQATVF